MSAVPLSSAAPGWLTVTPHRALFAVGAANLLLAMLVWALWLLNLRIGLWRAPLPALHAGSVHALIMPYLVFGPFIFGFLFTVFPRWMDVPAFQRRHYLPVGASLIMAQLCLLGGMAGLSRLHLPGLALGLLGWTLGSALLIDRLRRDRSQCWHARSAVLAMGIGWAGMLLAFLHAQTPEPMLLQIAVKLGVFGLLLPIYLTVAHRMFPFFARSLLPGYVMYRPGWILALLWPLLLGHASLELLAMREWLWLLDLPMTALGLWLLRRWWPAAPTPLLLRALFIGLAWLPLGFALYSAQSMLLLAGVQGFGLAPLHALTVGMLGALLVAMVSRVSKGHSGRALQMSRIDSFAFIAIQAVAVLRIGAEFSADWLGWNALAASAWVLVLLPWLLHCGSIWASPRADGRPG